MKLQGKKFVSCLGMLSVALAAFAQNTGNSGTLRLTLDKAIEIALAENPTIRVADKEILLKENSKTEAWQKLLPTADVTLSLSHSISVAEIKTGMGKFKMGLDGTTTAMGSLSVSLPIFAPAAYQNMKLTKEDILLAQEKARGSKLDLINQVTKAYYAVLLSNDSYEVLKGSYELAYKVYNLTENMYNVGSVSEFDKISADVQARNLKATLTSAETGKKLALLQLKVLMGVTADVDIKIDDSLKAYENKVTLAQAEYNASDINDNSALRTLDHNMTLLNRSRKIMNTGFMPTLALQYQYQYQSYSNENWNFFKYNYSPSSTLAIALSIPIFHADNFTKLKANQIQLSQLEDTRMNTQRQLTLAAESYKQNMASSVVQMESNQAAVKQANKAVSISSKRYEVGGGTIIELNQSETALTQAELTYSQSIYDFLKNKADLDYTLGRGYAKYLNK